MFGEFLNIIFKSIKLDRSLYNDNKNFGEASIYFAGLIMILDGVAGAVAANTIMKTAIGMSGLTAILTWFIWAIFIFVIGSLLFLALITYSPEDPNFIFPDNKEIKNEPSLEKSWFPIISSKNDDMCLKVESFGKKYAVFALHSIML